MCHDMYPLFCYHRTLQCGISVADNESTDCAGGVNGGVPYDEGAEGGSGRGGTPLWRSALQREFQKTIDAGGCTIYTQPIRLVRLSVVYNYVTYM